MLIRRGENLSCNNVYGIWFSKMCSDSARHVDGTGRRHGYIVLQYVRSRSRVVVTRLSRH